MKFRLAKMPLIVTALLFFYGCAAPYQFVEKQEASYQITGVSPEEAQIVFLRPSKGVMGVFHSIVFNITNGERKMIGVAPARSKFAINVAPGRYKFMSANGLPAHVMEAEVEAGKRYYVIVRPIYGNGLQLRPIKRGIEGEFSYNNPSLEKWKNDTKVAVMAVGAEDWYTKFSAAIDKTEVKAQTVWAEKSDEQRRLLTIELADGE